MDGESSDHLAIGMYINTLTPIYTNQKIIRRDWREYNPGRACFLAAEACNQAKDSINSDKLHAQIRDIHIGILDVLAPMRAFRVRDDLQIINSSIEALKKKRNREFIKYKKTGNPDYLLKSRKLTKTLRMKINQAEKDIIQKKAESHDPRVFWNTISELQNGKKA